MIQSLAVAALVSLGVSLGLTGRTVDGEGFVTGLIAFVLLALALAVPVIMGMLP